MNKGLLQLFLLGFTFASFLDSDDQMESHNAKVVKLDPNDHPKEDMVSPDPVKGMFAVDLSSYLDKEEGILSLKVFDRKDIKHFNAKYVTGIKEADFEKNMPKEKSEFGYIKSNEDEYSFMFFRRNDTKADPYLLIYVEFKTAKMATIALSFKERRYEVYSSNQLTNFNLEEKIPRLIKFNVERESDFGDSYIFHCNRFNYMTIVPGNLLPNAGNYRMNLDYNFYQMYGYTLPLDAALFKQFTVSLIIFGAPESITVSVKNTFSKLIYFNDNRPVNSTFHFEIVNAFDPFYILGTYKWRTDYLIYFERLYGNFLLYYKNTMIGDNLDEILPNEYNLVDPNFVLTSSDTDLLAGHCMSPCGFNIHFIEKFGGPGDVEMRAGDFRPLLSRAKSPVRVVIKEQGEVSVEIRNVGNNPHFGMEEIGVAEITGIKGVIVKNYISQGSKVLMFSSYSDAVFTVRIKSKNEYRKYKIGETITTKYGVYEIDEVKNMSQISEYSIFIKDLKEKGNTNLTFYLGYGPMNFFHDPVYSRIENYTKNTFKLLNPYLQKYPYDKLPDSKYYFIFKIDSPESINFQLSLQEQYFMTLPSLKEKTTTLIPKVNQFLLDRVEPEKQLVFMTTKCSKEDVVVKLKYYHIEFKGFYIQKQFAINIFPNPFSNTSVIFNSKNSSENFPGLMVYYSFLSANELEGLDFNNDFVLNYDLVSSSKEKTVQQDFALLSWRSPMSHRVNYNVTYDIYTYNEQTKNNSDQYDLCRTDKYNAPKTYKTNMMDLTYKLLIDRKKDNFIFIVAQPDENFKPKFFYRTIRIPKAEASRTPGIPLLWLYIIIGVLGALCIGLGVGYFFILNKRKKKVDMSKMPENSPLVED